MQTLPTRQVQGPKKTGQTYYPTSVLRLCLGLRDITRTQDSQTYLGYVRQCSAKATRDEETNLFSM